MFLMTRLLSEAEVVYVFPPFVQEIIEVLVKYLDSELEVFECQFGKLRIRSES